MRKRIGLTSAGPGIIVAVPIIRSDEAAAMRLLIIRLLAAHDRWSLPKADRAAGQRKIRQGKQVKPCVSIPSAPRVSGTSSCTNQMTRPILPGSFLRKHERPTGELFRAESPRHAALSPRTTSLTIRLDHRESDPA